jgi:SAM-dependent methyltransferase
LLDSVGDISGQRVLEIAPGTGHLAAAALARGATVVGIDVAPNMVALARQRAPGATFHVGNAEALPFLDQEFDAVLCCFGLLHLGQPARGVGEAARVLKPGGILAFTAWHAPEQGNEFFGTILKIFQSYANMEVGLPAAPPMFALADRATRDPMLTEGGFQQIRTRDIPIVWPIDGPDATFQFLLKGAVRTRMIYERQTPRVQRQIRAALAEATARYVPMGGIPAPAVVVTAVKGS